MIEDIPRSLHTVQVTHEYKRLTHSLTGNYVDHNSSFAETKDQVFIFNYYFNFKLPWGAPFIEPSIFGAAYNIFATSYIYRDVWPKPPRWVEAGLRFTF